jgi:hypothetical protein
LTGFTEPFADTVRMMEPDFLRDIMDDAGLTGGPIEPSAPECENGDNGDRYSPASAGYRYGKGNTMCPFSGRRISCVGHSGLFTLRRFTLGAPVNSMLVNVFLLGIVKAHEGFN